MPGATPSPEVSGPREGAAASASGDEALSELEVKRATARDEIDRAESKLRASASDCAAACRALASMARAVAHLCALADSPDDRRCEDAKHRLAGAREQVRRTCGSCPP
jgi:hypothetical protein